MVLITFYYFIFSFARINAYSNIENEIKYKLNHEYIYKNIIELSTWVEKSSNTKNIDKQYYKFKTYLYPINKSYTNYDVWKINIIKDNDSINPIFNELSNSVPKLIKVPTKNTYLRPYKDKFVLVDSKYLKPKKKYKSSKTIILENLDSEKIYNSLNVITKTSQEPFGSKFKKVFELKSASNIKFSGKIAGNGKEESEKLFFKDSFVLYKEKTTFNYSYFKGTGKDRKKYISKGIKYSFIDSINKVSFDNFYIENDVDNFTNIRYFVDDFGIFVPITINSSKKTNAYLNLNLANSYVHNNYFTNEIKDFTYYLFSPNLLKINKTKIYNPKFYLSTKYNNTYKVPLIIGNNILSSGFLYINDKKRKLKFISQTETEVPKEAINCSLINNELVFDVSINNNNTKAVVSINKAKNIVSKKLVKSLKLKTSKLGLSKNNPGSIKEKVELIVSTPFDKRFSKQEAYVEDFGDKKYNFVLGLDYLKNKELSMDFTNKWILIK